MSAAFMRSSNSGKTAKEATGCGEIKIAIVSSIDKF
jgi:hypothetical protein